MAKFIKPCHGYLNSFYGPRIHPLTGIKGTFHRGIDYTGASDDSIFAAAAGRIRFVDTSPTRTGFGKYIIITHDNGYETVYAHLSAVHVKVGQRVKQGQKIGVKGTTGNSTGMHLHFEMSKGRWLNTYANNVDPLPFISDPEIETVQKVLKEAGLYKDTIDGIHGKNSIAAVKAFQKKNGLTSDGVPGRGTMAAILREKAAQDKPKPALKPDPVKPAQKPKPVTKPKEPIGVPTPVKPAGKLTEKDVEILELAQWQREEMAQLFKFARDKKIFTDDRHEKEVLDGTMSVGTAIYLQTVIAAAALNDNKRVKIN